MRPVIVLTAWDRPHYMTRVLDSWRAVRGIGDALMLFQAEPFAPMVDLISAEANFAGETIIEVNTRRAGCEANTGRALATAFGTGADFVILGEDDGIVTQDVLEYLLWGAETYRADEDVFAVCTFQDAPPGALGEVRRAEWFFPPVWGFWRDRWDQVKNGWPQGPTPHSWDHYMHTKGMRPGQVVIQPMATRSQQIGEFGTYQRGSLQDVWDRQQFTAGIGLQEYREVAGVWTSAGGRIR